jgi:hypothetical protein
MIPTSHGTEERVTRLQGGSTLCPKNQNNLQWVQNAMAAKKGAGARGPVKSGGPAIGTRRVRIYCIFTRQEG